MQPLIRFVPTAEDLALAERLQERIAARERKRSRYSWRQTAAGLVVGLFLGVPGVLLLSQVSGPTGWLTLYMVLTPWLLAFLIVPFDRRRRAIAAAKSLSTQEMRLSEAALEISCGPLSSQIGRGGVIGVERLEDHIAVRLENSAVLLLPLRALSDEETAGRWLLGLEKLKAEL